ncbi:C25 family cysteine peptidase [Dyadobacter bucti]|uniref:putative type IX secretion system sortase PorU2 n=1 Tax=Dyadobacter bucti TaxID=2572203 RepID=UPI003F6F9138
MNSLFCKIVLLWAIFILSITASKAQWGAPYSNSWIQPDQPYVKIGISKTGIHKLPYSVLPANFPIDQPGKLQLWHRGKQVPILSLDNNEIVFYAVPNDGSTDSLFYRPMSSRMNPYSSMYSDESAYFLTLGNVAGLRIQQIDIPVNSSIPETQFHRANYVTTFKDEYSLTISNYLRPTFLNSYFELGASKTGKVSVDGKPTNFSLQLTGLIRNSIEKPKVKLLIHGRSAASRNIEIYAGKNAQSLRLVTSVSSSGHGGIEYSFELQDEDIDGADKSVLSLKSVSTSLADGYSIAYYKLSYPQNLDMGGQSSKEFELVASSETSSRISIANMDEKSTILDITDVDAPKMFSVKSQNLIIPRTNGRALTLLVTKDAISIGKDKVALVNLGVKYSPSSTNYIILTTENLLGGANQYAEYRRSELGGGHKVLVANIRDIYNHFNYGEPSPIAIRRFVDYMLSEGIKDQHLFLIGKSISYVERMIREIPSEVPTVGMPGSDLLLVEGLAGVPRDIPAIPVGRISAVSEKNVLDYLEKVKDYEKNEAAGNGWKKNILHLNGGKTVGEITQLKGILSSLTPTVENGFIGGNVKAFVKQQAIGETESVNITPEVNDGVGLITYFGHGSTTITDLDMGYATDAKRGYNNANRYPLMYFNGCGVGNIFNGKFSGYPTASDKDALSIDWIFAKKRGAIAVIANSLDSFVTPASKYLNTLYKYVFNDPSTASSSIGDIQVAVATKIVSENPNNYDIANIHQSLLQGDPVLKILSEPYPDYALSPDQGIKVYSESPEKTIGNSDNLKVKILLNNFGRFVKSDQIPVRITYFYNDSEKVSPNTIPSFAYHDTLTVSIPNERNIRRIEVKLDPLDQLNELSKENNMAELDIDWEVADKVNVYPEGSVIDIVAPLLDVRFNGRNIRNDEKLNPNPLISVNLEDDRFISIDTARIDLYIKACEDGGCDFIRVNYHSGDELSLKKTSNRSIELTYSPTNILKPGIYELLATGRDESGNMQKTAYTIRFVITDQNEILDVVASPNPASSFVRFETAVYGTDVYDLVEWTIYNLSGVAVAGDKISSSPYGVKEWYMDSTSLSAGLYLYKINFKKGNEIVKKSVGKIIITR